MTKQKSTKRALLMSALALLMCVSMLIGSTFAWFTDSVTSTGNIIKSGTLDVTMEWADGTKAIPADDSSDWTDASTGAIFKSELWEPGYTEVRHIKIANEGTLALKYQLNILANGEVSELADVIDVYYLDPAAQVADRAQLKTENFIGTLSQVLEQISTTASGNLPAGEKHTITLALKMQESAGNKYQDLAIGSDFSIQLLATQLTYEGDSFDDQYDVNAPKTEVATATELQKVLNDGGYAVLSADIAVEGNKRIDVPAGTYAVLDLNGHTLTSKDGGGSNTVAIYIDKGAVLTLNDSVGSGEIVSSCYGVYVKQNAKFIMNGGKLTVSGNGRYDYGVVVWNADFVMNAGTINAQHAVWVSNYYRDNVEAGLNTCYVKIADGCTLNSTGYADIEYTDAPDAVIDVPADVTLYPVAVSNAGELKDAIAQGKNVVLANDIVMNNSINLSNADFVLDGRDHTITMADDATNTYALFDITGGQATIKNVTFDGIRDGAIVRTVHAEFNADNVTAMNGNHTQINGLFRLLGKSTVTNCTFKNNICNMVISLNWDGANEDPQVVKNCVFENNTCNATAVVYYVKGASATIDGNKFVGNNVTVTGTHNAATLYMGFQENATITNNVFENNTVNGGTSERVAGAIMIGYDAVITGNSFVGNKVTGVNAIANDVAAAAFYTDIDLSGNYWGGSAPVENDDYYNEYPDKYSVIINDYLTTYGN